jgi:hypothetical protein
MSTYKRLFSELPNQNTFRVVEEENLFDTPGSEDECIHRLAAAVVFSAMQDAAGRTIGHKKEKSLAY